MGKIARLPRFVTLRESGFFKNPRRPNLIIDDEESVYIREDSVGNFKIGDGTHLRPDVYLAGIIDIGGNSSIGPCAYLEDCHLGPNADIEFTAQLKRADIGKNFTAKHHCYIGNTLGGNGINTGAGFITADYDGMNKHRTVIGDNVFLGTNVNVVAPIEIGKESMIAAGSTVTGNIPPYSMVIARAREQRLEKNFRRRTDKGYEKINIGKERFKLLKSVFSSLELNSDKHKDLIYDWLTTPHQDLNNELPIDLILKGKGNLVDALLTKILPQYPVWENND